MCIRDRFSRRRLVDCRTRNPLAASAVAILRKLIDRGFHDIFQDRKAPCHIAVERAVARTDFTLVARTQNQPAELVGKCHQEIATYSRLKILFRDIGIGSLEGLLKRILVSVEDFADGYREELSLIHISEPTR